MPDIRYVCLSDMHVGEESSLLTNLKPASLDPDFSQPSPVLKQLVECLRYLIDNNREGKKPTLVLNGDILELALAVDNQAAMVFERFVELIMPPQDPLFERIIYVPGNHDHHLWESARETQYVNFIERIEPGKYLNVPWHNTSMFIENDPTPVPLYFLTNLIQRYEHLKDFVIETAYPNLGLIDEDRQKSVIFHHGHFIEPIYLLMSTFVGMVFPDRKMPGHIWDLEAENYAWIDFFWSTMGRSGEAGQDIEVIYEKLQDIKRFKELLSNLAESLTKRIGFPSLLNIPAQEAIKRTLYFLADLAYERERSIDIGPLSKDAEAGFQWYMEVPLKDQILSERKGNMPLDVTFIFGHTHKPFQESRNFKRYPEWVKVYNTGGWVFENPNLRPIIGGAVALIDEDLNTVSLRMYNEDKRSSKYRVRVEETVQAGTEHTAFFQRVSELVQADNDPWRSFSATVANEIKTRALQMRVKQSIEKIEAS